MGSRAGSLSPVVSDQRVPGSGFDPTGIRDRGKDQPRRRRASAKDHLAAGETVHAKNPCHFKDQSAKSNLLAFPFMTHFRLYINYI